MVTALVELAPGHGVDDGLCADPLREYARAHLAGYKVPKRFLAVGSLPRTVAGKPDYPRLRALAAEP
jgi:acyl-CoA synthetase (AMP-forming)/AMP-acid ligase II